MNFSIRKTDSLAHETGYFKNSLDELKKEWALYNDQLATKGPEIIALAKALAQADGDEKTNKEKLNGMLSTFVEALGKLEESRNEHYQLLTEMDGLDFPLKTPAKLLKILEKEQDLLKSIQNVVKNLSKTISFYGNNKTDKELLENSIKSFEESFAQYKKLEEEYKTLINILTEELKKEHDRAKKYTDFV